MEKKSQQIGGAARRANLVSAGDVHIMDRQEQGWGYVKT